MFHVKHSALTDSIQRAAEAETPVSDRDAGVLASHLELVLDANERLNLTRITDPDEAIIKHVIDSLSALPTLRQCPHGELVDIGSGAGYPGLPLAIVSGRRTTLVESVKKKAAFLLETIGGLGLDVDVAPVRAEQHAIERPGAYAVVVARALTALPSLVELSTPLLREDGCLLAMKANLDPDELSRGTRAGELTGLRLEKVVPVHVPGTERRVLIVFRRVGPPSISLPRREGVAQKRPLA